MNFKDYYKRLSEAQIELRERVKKGLDISDKTFYNRLNADSWSDVEREFIQTAIQDISNDLKNLAS